MTGPPGHPSVGTSHPVHVENCAGFRPLSEAALMSPYVHSSHALENLRVTWEHVKMHLSGSKALRCWFSELELGPAACIFCNLTQWRVLKQGTADPSASGAQRLTFKWYSY